MFFGLRSFSLKNRKDKFHYGYLGLFVGSLISLYSVFYSFGGIYAIIAPNAPLNLFLAWLINFVFIILVGRVFGFLEHLLLKKGKSQTS